MKNKIVFSSLTVTLFQLLLLCHSSHFSASQSKFECLEKSGNVPELPKAYSADLKLNFINEAYTVEMIYSTNNKEKNEVIELWKKGRHVKYITRGDEGTTLFIKYQENKQPTCEVIKSTNKKDYLKTEDAGDKNNKNIFLKALEVLVSPSQYKIYSTGPAMDTGVSAVRYEGCLSEPKLNISITFATKDWKMPHATTSSQSNVVNYPELVEAEIGDNMIRAYYTIFNPTEPDNSLFQPPVNVFCKGFRTKKTPPKMPDFFSYSAETINYDSVNEGIIPLISQRKVYYDYKDRISRIDFNDLLASDTDLFTKTTAQKKSIIHDYNSGVQYIVDFFTGKCSIDTFLESFSALSFEETKDNKMFTGAEFFWLDNAETSYNGQFPLRGVIADVYTSFRIDPKTKKAYIITWFFSTETTQVAENENVEKNVLLSMSVRPEADIDKRNVAEIHFFDFLSEEPDVFNFDLAKCFNESSSKTLVITFPAHDSLRGSEKLVGKLLNIAIKDVTGVRKQRIYTKEVIFSGSYMYAEFSLLEDSPIKANSSSSVISLENALQKLKDSVVRGDFVVKVQSENITVSLKPEPNGLNVFAGDRPRMSESNGYHEGSVISLTVGMLFLGFLLGAVAINLIISRKYGVSLFQKSRSGEKDGNYSLNDSSL